MTKCAPLCHNLKELLRMKIKAYLSDNRILKEKRFDEFTRISKHECVEKIVELLFADKNFKSTEKRLLTFLLENEVLTIVEINKALDLSQAQTYLILKRFGDLNLLEVDKKKVVLNPYFSKLKALIQNLERISITFNYEVF